jgi:3-oxoacyl-[acyl-carrier protein] reductase
MIALDLEEQPMITGQTSRRVPIVTDASRHRGIGAAVCCELARGVVDIFFTHWSPYDQCMLWGAEEEPDRLRSELQAFGVRCGH